MVEECIEKLKPLVLEFFSSDGLTGGHDIGHLTRTTRMALYLQTKEGGDPLIIGIAAFLHDIHRVMQKKEGRYVTPKESLDTVKIVIDKANLDLTEEQVNKILFAIEHHEDYNWDGFNVADINTLILQDADNLDAIGAIGIGRAFRYDAIYNQPMYDESIPFENFSGYEEKMNDVSTIHFFHNKLVKLGDNMNTKTAKSIAKDRVTFINNFIDEFIKEWNSNY